MGFSISIDRQAGPGPVDPERMGSIRICRQANSALGLRLMGGPLPLGVSGSVLIGVKQSAKTTAQGGG